jgi:hypothetical protein
VLNLLSEQTKKDSYRALTDWFNGEHFSDPKKDGRNHFVAFSDKKGTVSVRTIDREDYQPHINCVHKDKFMEHSASREARDYKSLVYVMYLPGNGVQLIIPEQVISNYFTRSKKKWLVIPWETLEPGEAPMPGIIVRHLHS